MLVYAQVNDSESNGHQEPCKTQELIEKIKGLSPEKIVEVVDFVDFLTNRDERRLVEAASRMAEPAFARVWDNPDDAEYDNLFN